MAGAAVKRSEDDSRAKRTLAVFGTATVGLLCADPYLHGAAQIACFSATSLCGVTALGTAAQVDWRRVRRRGRQTPSTDHDGLPQELLLARLEQATRRLRIVDTSPGIVTDPVNGPRLFEILADRLARYGEFVVEAGLLCPLSQAMKERAKRLGRTELKQEQIAERALGEFEAFIEKLPPEHQARVRVLLYTELPSYASYRVDDSNLVAALVGEQRSQDAPYTDMAASSYTTGQCDRDYDQIRRSGLPLAEHRTGTLIVHEGAGEHPIGEVRFVRRGGEVFVALPDRDDRAFVKNCDSVTWRHCGQESVWAPKAVEPPGQADLQAELDELWAAKYLAADRHPFFQLGTVP